MALIPDPLNLFAGLLNEALQANAQLAEDGAIHLTFGDSRHLAIALSPDQHDLVFFSVLGSADGGRGIVRIAAAMRLNLHQVATRGGAIGLDSDNQTLVFSWRMPISNTEPPVWLAALDQFCATVLELHQALDDVLGDWSDADLSEVESRARRLSELDEGASLETTHPASEPASADTGPGRLPGSFGMIRG